MPQTFESSLRMSDLILRNYDPEYCFEEITYTNATGEDVVLPIGYPMTLAGAALLAAAVNTTACLNLRRTRVPDGKAVKLLVLRRGPAVIKEDGLPTEDIAGDAFNMTTFKTAIAALSPVILVRAPMAEVSEQTT